MKHQILFSLLALLFCGCITSKKTSNTKKFKNTTSKSTICRPENKAALDSLLSCKTSYDSLFNHVQKENSELKGFLDYKYELFRTPNNKAIAYATSNNAAVKAIFENLSNISPVDFVVQLRGIRGRIVIQADRFFIGPHYENRPNTFPEKWITREHLGVLLELTKVPVTNFVLEINSTSSVSDLAEKHFRPENRVSIIGAIASQLLWEYYIRKLGVTIPYYVPGGPSLLTPISQWYESGTPESELQSFINKYASTIKH